MSRLVCVVTEERIDGSGKRSLFGVFTSEALARKEYGAEDNTYLPHFDLVPLWGDQ